MCCKRQSHALKHVQDDRTDASFIIIRQAARFTGQEVVPGRPMYLHITAVRAIWCDVEANATPTCYIWFAMPLCLNKCSWKHDILAHACARPRTSCQALKWVLLTEGGLRPYRRRREFRSTHHLPPIKLPM